VHISLFGCPLVCSVEGVAGVQMTSGWLTHLLYIFYFTQVNRQCVPVHTVYSFNLERILAQMWHPSQDDDKQRKTVKQWKDSIDERTPYSVPSAVNHGHRSR
jgi:hypothetical protein